MVRTVAMPAPASASGPTPDKTRRSRITAACGVCRGKRQKCSGERPVCDQCKLHKEECWWSETKKRGPAKDYLRALQDRLQDTEKLLLAVLARTSDAELLHVLRHEDASSSGPSHQAWASSMSGSEYWSLHPLNSLDGIRAWQSHRRSGGPAVKHMQRSNTLSTIETTMPRSMSISRDDAGSQSVLESPSSAGVPEVGVASLQRQGPYYQDWPARHQRNDSWPAPEAAMTRPDSRRYSEETREAGEALFSISKHMRTTSQQPLPQPPPSLWDPQEAKTSTNAALAAPNQGAQSQFPKHLFW